MQFSLPKIKMNFVINNYKDQNPKEMANEKDKSKA